MNTFKNFLKSRIAVALFLLVAFGGIFSLGAVLGYQNRPEVEKVVSLVNKEYELPDDTDFAPFWKAWNVINEKYVAAGEVESQAKVWGAIEGLAKSLGDEYTVFMPPVEAKNFDTQISGAFEGVGMEIGVKDGVITVVSPLKGSPAEKAGMKAGDKVLQIDKKSTNGMTTDEAVKLIRGQKGTTVTLTVLPKSGSSTKEVKIVRDTITIPTIDTEERADGIFVIRLYNFSGVANGLFRDALQKFVDSGKDKLVLDLRGNPGGYLDAAVDMASWFLPKGTVIVREDYGGKRPEDTLRSSGYDIFSDKLKMVILVNEGSASASEILAGALSEHGVAKLVGSKTFGKGSVQELVRITPDTNLKVTIARWLTPNGVSISQKGIVPEFVVDMTQADIDNQRDPQMDKAVKILLGK